MRASSASIPARAGEPLPPAKLYGLYSVYPRACGGTSDNARESSNSPGLSPRVRGNPLDPHVRLAASWVYPRACGGTGVLLVPVGR